MTRLSVIGRSCRLPGVDNVAAFWDVLVEGRCTVTNVPEERFSQSWYLNPRRGEPGKAYTFAAGVIDDIWGFDPGVFSITPREARQMDPQQRLLLQLVWEALEDAGVPPSAIAGQRIGVYVGASSMDYSHRQFFDPAGTDSYLMTGNTLSLISNRVSYIFDLKGPSLTIDTACSSSLVALDYAAQDLKNGRIDTAIVGGVNALLSPFNFMGFCAASMLSPDGLCRPFDHRGNGYVRAEGGVVMILQRDDAPATGHKSYGSIIASGMNADGRTSGVALPSADQQAALLHSLYDTFEIDPNDLAFVEAHGTGTLVGDPAEAGALGRTLGQHRTTPLPIGSAKSNVGHLEPASGIVGLLKAQLALENGLLPRSLHVEKLNPHIPFDELNLTVATDAIALEASPATPLRAGINNFGFGGTNVHVVIEAPAKPVADPTATPEPVTARPISLESAHRDPAGCDLLMISANCPDGLRAQAANYARSLRDAGHDGVSHRAIAAATAHRRERLPERLIAAGRTTDEIATTLERFANSERPPAAITARAVASSARTALVFSGNGAQWDGMGRSAFDSSATFRHQFRAIDDHYRAIAGDSLETLLFADDLAERLTLTEIAQPLLFAIQMALTRTLEHQGLVITATLGHSVGEVAAAHIAGALDLAQAVAVIRARSHHQELAAGQGLMAAVQADAETTIDLIRDSGLDTVEIAAFNSPRSVTVSGAPDDIHAFARIAEKQAVAARILDINYPFHSARLDPVRAPLLETLTDLQPAATTGTMYSTVTGAVIAGTELGPNYWWENVRRPVRFENAVKAAADDGIQLFIEIGPRPILAKYIADTAGASDLETAVVTSLEVADTVADDPLRRVLARALAAGATVDTDTTFGRDASPDVALPAYPWQNKSYLFQISPEALDTFNTANRPHPLLGLQLRPQDFVWDSHLDTGMVPFLADHCVAGKPIMPGTGYVEMALSAAAQRLNTREIELRDFDFVQALELHDEACQAVRTRLDLETDTVEISSRPRLTLDEHQTHARARFAKIPSEDRPVLAAPARIGTDTAPILDGIYRLAEKFGLDYGPAFRRVTACREIGDTLIEVELSPTAHETPDESFILHPVDFDACFHGLNVVYERLVFGETKLAYVPVHLGRLRIITPGRRIATARIHLESYNTRAVRAGFELFAADGSLIAIAENVRFRASSLVHRLNLAQAAYHIDQTVHPLPGNQRPSAAPNLTELLASHSPDGALSEIDTTRHEENRLLLDMAARRAAFDAIVAVTGPDRVIDLALTRPALSDCGSDNDNVDATAPASPLTWRRDDTDCRTAMASLIALLASSDLATAKGDEALWQLIDPDNCSLPPLDDIVTTILEEDPAWSAECVMLLNASRHLTSWLALNPADADGAPPTEPTDQVETPQPRTPAIADVYSLAQIEQFMTATPEARLRIARVAGLVGQAIEHWPEGRPLRILQLGAGAGGLSRALEPVLATARARNTRAHLVIADTDETWTARLASLYVRTPGIDTIHIDATLAALDTFAPFDIVVSAGGLHGLENITVLFENLEARLADGAIAAITELEPSAFHDVVFAGTRAWFATNLSDGIAHGRLRDAARWSRLLETAGLTPHKAPQPNSDLILAQAKPRPKVEPQPVAATNGAGPAPEPAAQTADSPAAAPLLIATAGDDAAPPVAAALRDLAASTGRTAHDVEPGNIVSTLTGLPASAPRPELVFIAASDPNSANPHAELLAATSRLTTLLQTLGDHPARLWIIAPGGARALAGLGPADPVQTGVWGYARSALNEYPDRDLRIVDIADTLTSAAAAVRLDALITSPPALAEFIIAPDALHGLEVRRGAPPQDTTIAPAPEAASLPENQTTVLELTESGDLDALKWITRDRRPPAAGEVEIEVTATGLNFRDVMWSLGLLPEEALEDGFAGPTVGFECAGRIVRVGEGVADVAAGDRVIAMAPACFASHVTVTVDAVARLPDNVALEDAATIPVAFLTAQYALDHLAHLRKDEWVLIHGAAGGVGLAAIQIARRLGARIIATAGSDEKRNLLRALGAEHVLDTRSLEFADEVRRLTGGGVDVALNSLAGEAMERTIELMRPFGRFLELGKRDFYANTKIALRPFRRNVSYFGIDADQLLTYRPDVVRRVFAEIIEGFADGTYTPLPYRTFEATSVVDAFRLMQKSGHIGKILVTAPEPAAGARFTKREFAARPDATHIIVGGTGGFGLELARWLADRGARHILLTSRTGKAKSESADALDSLRADLTRRNITLEIARCDATDAAALGNLLASARTERPIAGIALTAMVLADGVITNQTPERIAAVLAPKVSGAANLDRLTRDDELDYFLLFSSAATLFGNPGQANYTAANGYLDGLARARAASGLKATSIAWGAISDVGVLTRDTDTAQSLARHTGGIDFKARDGLNLLAHVLVREDCDTACANVALATMNWSMAADILPIVRTPAYALIRREAATGHGDLGQTVDIHAAIQGLDDEAARNTIAGYLAREVAAIFRMPVEDISLKRSLADIGMDSLMGLELRMAAQRGLGIELPVVSISDGTTINDIAARVLPRLRGTEETGDAAANRDTLIEKHVSEHIDEADIAHLERRVAEHEAGLKKVV